MQKLARNTSSEIITLAYGVFKATGLDEITEGEKNMETRRERIKDKCRKCLSETLDQEWT